MNWSQTLRALLSNPSKSIAHIHCHGPRESGMSTLIRSTTKELERDTRVSVLRTRAENGAASPVRAKNSFNLVLIL
jgi:hypothetical protein